MGSSASVTKCKQEAEVRYEANVAEHSPAHVEVLSARSPAVSGSSVAQASSYDPAVSQESKHMVEVVSMAGERSLLEVTLSTTIGDLKHLVASAYNWPAGTFELVAGTTVPSAQTPVLEAGSTYTVLRRRLRRILCGLNHRNVKCWDMDTLCAVYEMQGHRKLVCTLVADFSLGQALSGSDDATLRHWDLETGIKIQTLRGHDATVMSLAADFALQKAMSGSIDATMIHWDLQTGAILQRLSSGQANYIYCISADFCNSRVIGGYQDASLKYWDLKSGTLVKTLRGHRESVVSMVADFVSGKALSGSLDTSVKLWDLTSGEQLQTFRVGFPVYCLGADFSEGIALTGDTSGCLKRWDMQTSRILRTFKCRAAVYCVVADFSEQIAITGSANALCCWNLLTGKKLWRLSDGINDKVLCVAAQF
eukprot:TRINITY_DN93757_c0_g1_i1.p1 TRINITY_DN93757_c0_g1~~TRINITY_DN93757_c0_g1_i1.p1  ORF type:complete len:422 (-),score=58.56 TRINITY_DN93757_c0_g1_i1:379-1644(-)